jgi:transcriptional regulator with XRE-family HTH domain
MTKMKARRQEMKLTQTAVGYLSGVSPADVSRIENRRLTPYETQATRIGKVLKLRPEELQEPAASEPVIA